MSEGKISFSFGGAASKPSGLGPAPSPGGPMSNLELLMAKAKQSGPSSSSVPSQTSKPPKPKGVSLFDDDDEAPASRPPPSAALFSKSKPSTSTSGGAPHLAARTNSNPSTATMSRSERRQREEALKIDQSVYDYDGVYDGMKAAERAAEVAKKAESADRKPKYIENFLASAQTRRLDKLRAEEKMLALEREKEGGEFDDKEKFVTEAYKRQMEEVRKAEEEEKKREEALRKSQKGPGLTALYQSMLEDSEAKHAAAVAASASGSTSSGPSLAIKPPTQISYDEEEEYDPLLAAEARKAGTSSFNTSTKKEVEVNDEGEVVDKRSLLKAGLNITKKPKPVLPAGFGGKGDEEEAGAGVETPYVSRAVGSAASYQERMARERKRLAEQVKEEERKKREEQERKRKEEEEAARRRREGDDGEAERRRNEAKERFLARKRARDEADTEAKKKPKEGE